MKEDFLHYLWKYQLLDISQIQTTQRESLAVISPGLHNQDAGPDFSNARIQINDQTWVGTVEIHLKSSDWYWHQHENDPKYDTVILHVVWDHDVEVFMKNEKVLPTLELKDLVSADLLEKYQNLSQSSVLWIPCEQQIHRVDDFVRNHWMERLYIERLERKSLLIQTLLKQTHNDWDAVLFVLLAKNFGLNKNGEAFFQLAKSIPFSVLRKESHDAEKLNALFFGQAGFLEETLQESYFLELKKEYQYLKRKYHLKPLSKQQFHFFRMRPSNFPTIRMAQLAALYTRSQSLFAQLMKAQSVEAMYALFDVSLNFFWRTHYTFAKASKMTHKKLTTSFIDLLIINTILPLKFAYQRVLGNADEHGLISLLESLKPEKNAIISKFEELKIPVQNAFDSQALLELKNNYCAPKRCLECAIGNQLLKMA
jgi:hypothetical protein